MLQSVGGGVQPDDLLLTGDDVVLATGENIDAGGTITGHGRGFTANENNGVMVFRFKSLTVSGDILLTGALPIALVANGPITIDAIIDARGPCAAAAARAPGPGGVQGGDVGTSAGAPGGGEGANGNDDGGGGGGHGSTGGAGNSGQAGGGMFGDLTITSLAGGGGGGGGKTSLGGGGGGAIQLVSNVSITINPIGGINAGGCGGGAGANGSNDAGGGGGAGGTIVLEAPVVTLAGALAVNGGSGGDKNTPGDAGKLASTPATAGGGDGGAGNVLAGGASMASDGGGGAVGRIRVNTKSGTTALVGTPTISPPFTNPTTATEGVATVQ